MNPAVWAGPGDNEVTLAVGLDSLQPDRDLKPEDATREAVAFTMAMEGQHDARFVLQMVAEPQPSAPESGTLQVHLLVTVRGADGESPSDRRINELADDVLDILSAPPRRASYRLVDDEHELHGLLTPVEPTHLAEIARREEPCSPLRWTSHTEGFGFARREVTHPPLDAAERRQWDVIDRSLWSMWSLGPASRDLERLAAVLLAQEAPVGVRTILCPTALTPDERLGVEELIMATTALLPDVGLLRASLSTLESLLYLRPIFEVRCLVASPDPISRSLLSALGHSVSEPARASDATTTLLQGGFAVIRGGTDVEASVLRSAFDGLMLGEPIPSLAPAGLERLRRLLGTWEAANVFRLPSTDDDFPGIESLNTPELEPPLSNLATAGRRLGRLVAPQRPVLLDPVERFRHLYVVGQTGTGKSTLLLNLALQDIEAGAGVAVLDPHGDLVEAVLRNVPEHRLDDVVLVDPADTKAVVGVNLLEAETPVQQGYIVAELADMFTDLFDPGRIGIVGPRFETMLRQAALLLMAHPEQPSSMLDISTLFVDPAVRAHLVKGLTDPILAEFWQAEMSMPRSNEWQEVVSWFRSKFEIFRTSPLVRNVVGQAESTISFSDVLNDGSILLVNLSKGLLGQYNSSLIGHIVFARLWSAALERASIPESERRDFFVYIDEFQNMTSDSLPDVLSEARKFRVGITLANQFLTQIPERTRDAIMGNVGNRVTFRLGPVDAGLSSSWLGGAVNSNDLITLPNHTAVAALSDAGVPLDPLVLRTDPPRDHGTAADAERARQRSRERWARPVDQLDPAFFARWRHIEGSIAAAAAGVSAPPAEQASFLDDWLARRREVDRTTLHVSGTTDGNVLDTIRALHGALPGLSLTDAKALVDQIPEGVDVPGVDPESVDHLIDQLRALDLTVSVTDDGAAPAVVDDDDDGSDRDPNNDGA